MIKAVVVDTTGGKVVGPAIPVEVLTAAQAAGLPVEGKLQRVVQVTDADIAAGRAKVVGGRPIPVVVGTAGIDILSGPVLQVYVMAGSLGAVGSPPINNVLPVISGTLNLGQSLSTTNGTWTGASTFTYQWKRNGVNIGGATANTYATVAADVGPSITVTVTATNADGSTSASSAGVTIFSPLSVAGLQMWFDANAITGLVDGDPVSTWSDLSGNARHLTQTAGNRPLYKAGGGLNNQPYVLPDNVDDRMALASSYVTSGAFTFFEVFNYATLSGNGIIGFNANNYRRVTVGGSAQMLIGGVAVTLTAITTFNAATWYIWCIRKDGANNITVRRNGIDITSGGPSSANNETMQFWFAQTGITTSNVSLSSSLVYDSALSDAQCAQIESYLSPPHPF